MTTPSTAGTATARSGDALIVSAVLYNPNGSIRDLSPIGTTVRFNMFPESGGAVLIDAQATVTNAAGGAVTYSGTPADTARSGEFLAYFSVSVAGSDPVAYPADGISVLVFPALSAPRGLREGPCFPWTDSDRVRSLVSGIDPNTELTEWIEAAGEIMFALTGRQFPGLCSTRIRPAHRTCSCGGRCAAHLWGWPFSGAYGFGPYGLGGSPLLSGWEGAQSILLCASEIDLGHDARQVLSVKIDGVEIDPATWRLDPFGKLVRQPDASGNALTWPCCERTDAPSGQLGTFEVTYVYGEDPPTSVVLACAVLAGQMALSANPATAGQCKLPTHVQNLTRQGVTASMLSDLSPVLDKGYLGIPEVDFVIAAFNPAKLQRRARVLSPDVPPHRVMGP